MRKRLWLDRIREHLIENLSLEREDFDLVPVLQRAGGLAAAGRTFGARLDRVIHDLKRGHRCMTDVVQMLWGFCRTLRHDGIDYGDYIEQITYLLFLKMADKT